MSVGQNFSIGDTRVRIHETDQKAFEQTSLFISELIAEALALHDVANVVVAAGNSISKSLSYLSVNNLNWEKVNWYLADERCVASTDSRSNQFQIRKILAETINVNPERVFGPDTQVQPEKAANDYASRIKSINMFDFCLLGMGNDGHIASLLPNHSVLNSEKLCCVVGDSPNPPAERITMTLKVLTKISRRILVTAGEEKASAVRQYIADPTTPVRLFDPTIIFADKASYR